MPDASSADSIEASGLRALIRAGEARDWFSGHFGAAFLAGAQLVRSRALPPVARHALTTTLARLEAAHAEWYGPLDARDDGGRATSEPLVRALTEHVGRLRTSGHGTIYLVAALRAFGRRPALASQRGIAALLALHAAAQEDTPARYLGCDDYTAVVRDAVTVPATPASLALAVADTFRSCRRLTPDIVRNGRPHYLFGEKIHVVTHLHALYRLAQLGHGGLAAAGLRAQRVQLELGEVPDDEHTSVPAPTSLHPAVPEFWASDGRDVWHKLKLAEAAAALVPLLPPDERAAARRALAGMWALLGVHAPTAPSRSNPHERRASC